MTEAPDLLARLGWDDHAASAWAAHRGDGTVPGRVAAGGDPWAAMTPQSIDPLLVLHERDLAEGLMDAPWPPVYPKMPNEPPRVAPSRARKDKDDG